MNVRLLNIALAALVLSGCTTLHETQPAQSATQQLLTSHAAELAATKLAEALPADGSVYIDASHFKGDGFDYALEAIQAALIKHGMVLVADQKTSHITVALRMGALSIDQADTVFGLPAGDLPIPGTVTAFPIPELSVYSVNKRIGKAEFSAYAYDTKTGAPVAFSGPAGGEEKLVFKRYLTVFHRGSRLEEPGPPSAVKP
ncbi:MAG: DUF6655 family protein [Caulobacteraceae bacterium]